MKGIIEAIDKESLKESVPSFNVGDTVKVSVKVIEGSRERIQGFEGVVIARKGGGIGAMSMWGTTMTVRNTTIVGNAAGGSGGVNNKAISLA